MGGGRRSKQSVRRVVLALLLALGWPAALRAELINHELKFSAYTQTPGQTKEPMSVPGRTVVSLNGIPITDEQMDARELSIGAVSERPTPLIWVPMHQNDRFLRQRDNLLQLRFIPTDGQRPYTAWLSWHGVSDREQETREVGEDGSLRVIQTNIVGLEEEQRPRTGELLVERRFDAPWVSPQPWQNQPPIQQLSAADEQTLRSLVQERRHLFQTDLDAAYKAIPTDAGVDVAALRQNRCLEMVQAGARLGDTDGRQVRLRTTGGPVVVAEGSSGELFPRSFPATFGEQLSFEQVMCLSAALAGALPKWMLFVKTPDGGWRTIH